MGKTNYHLVPDERVDWRKPTDEECRQAEERRKILREQLRRMREADVHWPDNNEDA